MSAVTAARASSCAVRSLVPMTAATIDSSSRTTTSMATPMSSSGAMSSSWLPAVSTAARRIRRR